MTTLMEEMRLVVLQIWQALGFERSSRTAAAVVPALVLGIALNVIALGVIDSVRTGSSASCEKAKLTWVARTELQKVHMAAVSTLKKIGAGQRGFCFARRWMLGQPARLVRYRSQMRCAWRAHVSSRDEALSITIKLPWASHCARDAAGAA